MSIQIYLAALLFGQTEPRVIAVLEGEEFDRRGIVADLVERPAGVPDETFAQQLVDAEGLRPWDGRQLDWPARQDAPAAKAVFSGDGREIIVYYAPSNSHRPGRVCRMRLARGGMSDAYWQARRWCAAAFGYSLPETPPPPPIVTVVEPPPR